MHRPSYAEPPGYQPFDTRPDDDIRAENSGLRTQVMNLLGQCGKRENFVPRVVCDLASQLKLDVVTNDTGCWAGIKLTHHADLGS